MTQSTSTLRGDKVPTCLSSSSETTKSTNGKMHRCRRPFIVYSCHNVRINRRKSWCRSAAEARSSPALGGEGMVQSAEARLFLTQEELLQLQLHLRAGDGTWGGGTTRER